MDKIKNLGIFILTIFIACVAIGTVTIVTVAVTRMLTGLCKCTIWNYFYIPNFIISDNLIMFFWILAVFIVGGSWVFVSRYNEKEEKSREKAANKEEERMERMQRVAEYDKLPNPFTFPILTYCSTVYYKNITDVGTIDNSLYCLEIKANLHHLCRNVINVIKLRFSREHGNVEFHCVSGYRCTDLNKESNFKEKKWMNTEHKEGKAIDIDIFSAPCNSTKDSDSIKNSDLTNNSDSTKPSNSTDLPEELHKLFIFIMDRNNCGDLPLDKVILVTSDERHWIHISSYMERLDYLNKREFATLVNGKYEPTTLAKFKKENI